MLLYYNEHSLFCVLFINICQYAVYLLRSLDLSYLIFSLEFITYSFVYSVIYLFLLIYLYFEISKVKSSINQVKLTIFYPSHSQIVISRQISIISPHNSIILWIIRKSLKHIKLNHFQCIINKIDFWSWSLKYSSFFAFISSTDPSWEVVITCAHFALFPSLGAESEVGRFHPF